MSVYRDKFSLKVDGKHILAWVSVLPDNIDFDISITTLIRNCDTERVCDCWPCQEPIEGREVNGFIGLKCDIDKRIAILTIENTLENKTLLEKEYPMIHSHGNTWIIKLSDVEK